MVIIHFRFKGELKKTIPLYFLNIHSMIHDFKVKFSDKLIYDIFIHLRQHFHQEILKIRTKSFL